MAKSADKAVSAAGFDPWLSSQRLFPPYVWSEVFGRTAPLELDLGAGDGVYVEARARREPERDFIAVERLLGRATKIAKKARRGDLTNLRVLRLESGYFVHPERWTWSPFVIPTRGPSAATTETEF